ncbi:MAG: DUF3800 domain-containing protein [Alphaproteobacteria bacterium]|nr:DUF3800 domain-containing protein [Alphaproteobacteria bacterium]
MGRTPSYHLYLDDSGNRLLDNKGGKAPGRNDGLDYFALGGLLIASEDVDLEISRYRALTEKHDIAYPLHSHKIRTRKEEFRWLESDPDRARLFYKDFEQYIHGMSGLVTGCVIDRPGYNARFQGKYGDQRWEPAKSAYTIAVERAAKYAIINGRKLIVYVEQTGKHEDREISEYHSSMRNSGMIFDDEKSSKYSPLDADSLRNTLSVRPSFVTKKHPLAQIADMVLYPIVKGKYNPSYPPYRILVESKKLIDCVLSDDLVSAIGIKYYCFDRLALT